jgi:copper transport protein
MNCLLRGRIWRVLLLALPLALGPIFLLPDTSQAQAIPLRSNPAQGAVLLTAPSEVQIWFSENLNPVTSTARVVNSANQRVDVNGAIVIPTDQKEMDVSVQPSLPPGVYVVIWRTQSADDGQVLTGSFLFNIANPDGTVPKVSGPLPDASELGAASSGQLDGPALFLLLMVTAVDLCTIFWVGGQLWRAFVLDSDESGRADRRDAVWQAQQRFERMFSQSLLRVLFIANIGVLLGLALAVTGGNWSDVFSPTLLAALLANGHFGTFWTMREVVVVLAMVVGTYIILAPTRARRHSEALTWINLLLGLALLIALTLSGDAAAVSGTPGIAAVLVDWLHLLAASLWIGGILYVALVFLPVLKHFPLSERVPRLLATLARFLPLTIAGVVITALGGPFNATVHMSSFSQLYATAYGRTLIVKVICVGALLITSAIHFFSLQPRLARTYQQYTTTTSSDEQDKTEATAAAGKHLEQEVIRQTRRLTSMLRWEALLGVAVLLCTALLTVSAGTLAPVAPTSPASQHVTVKPYTTTAQTSDQQYTVTLAIAPDLSGLNTLTVTVKDKSGKLDSNVSVSLSTTMLDMDMGTNSINLQPAGQGKFSANGDLDMAGHWEARIQLRTPDHTLHEATVKFAVGV